MNSDMEGAQVIGAAHSFFKLNNPAYSALSNDTPAEEAAPEVIKLCTTHAKRGVLSLKSLVSEEDHRRLMDFVYIDSAEKIEEFSDFVGSLKEPKLGGIPREWILPCLIKSQSPMSAEDCDNTPATTNTGEAQPHWTNSLTDIKLSPVEAIESARKVDEGVAREIEIALTSGVLSRELRELEEELALLEMEINAEKEARNATAARLKALQARKSATRKPAAKRRGAGTVVVGSNSSGRVTTRTIPSTPLRSTSNDADDTEPPSPSVASTSATALSATDFAGTSAPMLSIPDTNVCGYGIENSQQLSDSNFVFDFSFMAPGPSNLGDDIAWLNSLMFDANMPYESSGGPAGDYLAPSSPVPVFDPLSVETATASKKRKTRDEVDPENMIEGPRARKTPKRLNI
ncbi:hypothetical protein B0H13DRAFT_1906408 [Mycena leptocephala]|nr:hypothetical protein B0H13DRAFT_1906408 [Mycena leptocephala]